MVELTKSQQKIVSSNGRFRTIRAGRRFGKTFLFALEMLGRATSKKTNQIYAAPTIGEARDIMWDLLTKMSEPVLVDRNESRLELQVQSMDGISKIKLMGWENKVADRFRGQHFDHIYLDEVAKMPGKDFMHYWQNAVRPTLIDKKGGATFASTPRGFNHFYDLTKIDTPEWEHFHFTSYDNPHLDPEELGKLQEELPEDAVSQEIFAEFTKQSGLVYSEFEPHRHIKKDIPFASNEMILGLDYGFTHPTAGLVIHTDGDNFHVSKELYEPGRTHEEVADWAYLQKTNQVFSEPAEPALKELMKRKNMPVKDVSKDVIPGITRVKQLLKAERLTVSPECKGLIREFDMYVWNNKKQDSVIKEYDDALDALRYALYNYQGRSSQWKPTYAKPKSYR